MEVLISIHIEHNWPSQLFLATCRYCSKTKSDASSIAIIHLPLFFLPWLIFLHLLLLSYVLSLCFFVSFQHSLPVLLDIFLYQNDCSALLKELHKPQSLFIFYVCWLRVHAVRFRVNVAHSVCHLWRVVLDIPSPGSAFVSFSVPLALAFVAPRMFVFLFFFKTVLFFIYFHFVVVVV